jgi:hypothetical protein
MLAFLCFPTPSRADACFADDVADRMIVYIEQCKILEQEAAAQESGNAELQKQIEILKNTIKAMEELLALEKQKEEMYKSMIETQNTLMVSKDKICQQQIKEAKPTFFQELGKYSIGTVVGAIIVGIIILL